MTETPQSVLEEWLDGDYKEVYAPDAEQMMLAALREVVEYCDRELQDQYPAAWAGDIKALIEKEVLK